MTIGGVPPQLINHGLLSRGCHYPIKISQRSCDGDLMITECKNARGFPSDFYGVECVPSHPWSSSVGMMKFRMERHNPFHGSKPPTSYYINVVLTIWSLANPQIWFVKPLKMVIFHSFLWTFTRGVPHEYYRYNPPFIHPKVSHWTFLNAPT